MAIELTAAEIEGLKMNTTEYSDWAWVNPSAVVSAKVAAAGEHGKAAAASPSSPAAGGVMTGGAVPPPGGVTRTSCATSEAAAKGYEGGFKYHPALRRSCADFLRVARWEALVARHAEMDDAALGAAFRRFVADDEL